ncbi:hypothetical protein [Lysobacter humi (ex Lee et al. 2017)]
MRAITALAVVALCSGCARETDEVVAALFEPNPKPPFAICLKVEGHDPSPSALKGARAHNPRVFPASQCRLSSTGYRTAEGESAELLSIESIEWQSCKVALVEVSAVPGAALGGSGWVYTVEKLSGFWVVTGGRMEWIS